MLSDLLQDWLINKLNGYFLVLYAGEHLRLAGLIENMNDLLVFFLILMRLIPPRRRIKL